MSRPGPTPRSVVERFWEKVNKDGPVPSKCPELGACWIWTAAVFNRGHGDFQYVNGRRHVVAHRFAYELLVGPVGALQLHHMCETPACVNPAHLKPVTQREHGLEHRAETCSRGHDLAEHGYYRKTGTRALAYCRICHREDRRLTRRSRAKFAA